jgi:hypothetical protein
MYKLFVYLYINKNPLSLINNKCPTIEFIIIIIIIIIIYYYSILYYIIIVDHMFDHILTGISHNMPIP